MTEPLPLELRRSASTCAADSDTVTSVNFRYNNKSIGLQLNVPMYSGGRVNAAIRQALADKDRRRESR